MRIEEVLKTNRLRDNAHKALLNIIYTSYWLNDNLSNVVKPFGITLEQFNVLRILRGSLPNAICVRNIRERMIEKSSNVPRILDRLERKNYILRKQSEHDRRETDIFITEAALNLLKEMDNFVANHERKLLNLSEEELLTLSNLLEKIRDIEENKS